MICAIGLEQQVALTTALHKILKDKDVFNLEALTREIYDLVLQQSENKDMALAYARLVPTITSMLLTSDSQLRKNLKASEYMNDVLRKADLYEESLDNVVKDLSDKTLVNETQDLIELQKMLNEEANEIKANLAANQIFGIVSQDKEKFFKYPPTFLSISMWEDKSEKMPVKVARNIVASIAKSSEADLQKGSVKYPGAGPIFLKMVKTKDLGEENYKRDENDSLTYIPQESDRSFAVVNDKEEFVYFDNDGNVVSKESGGRIAYYEFNKTSRFADVNDKDEVKLKDYIQIKENKNFRYFLNHLSYVQSGGKMFDDLTPEQQSEVVKIVKQQLLFNHYLEKLGSEGKIDNLVMNITGGSLGFKIKSEKTKYIPLSEVSTLSSPNSLQVDVLKRPKYPQPYFLSGSPPKQIEIKIGTGINDPHVDTIMELLFNRDLYTDEKIKLTDQQRNEELLKLVYTGSKAGKNGVIYDFKQLRILFKNGKFIVAATAYDSNKGEFDLRTGSPLIDISERPDMMNIVRTFVSNTMMHHIRKNDSPNDFSYPVAYKEGGVTFIRQERKNYNEWVRTNPKFRIESRFDPITYKDPYITFLPTNQAALAIATAKKAPSLLDRIAMQTGTANIDPQPAQPSTQPSTQSAALADQTDQLLKNGLEALKKANAGKTKYVLAFHGGRKFDKPDRSKQYTGEFRSADARRIAESSGARYEGQMLFFTNEEGDELYNYKNAIDDATLYALRYGDENPTVYAYLIPVEYADFTDRGVGEVGLSYDAIEQGKYKEVGRVTFSRSQPTAPAVPTTVDKIDRFKDLVKRMDKQMFDQFLNENPDLEMQTIDFDQWEKDMKIEGITNPAVKEEELTEGNYFEIERPTKKDLLKKLDSTNPLDQKYFFYDLEQETDISLSEFADRFNNYAREVAPDIYYRGTTQEIPFDSAKMDTQSNKTALNAQGGTRFDKYTKGLDFEKLQNQKNGNIKATPEQIEEARKWYESSPLSKYFPFEVLFNAVNSANPHTVASWTINGITLYKGSDYSDLYHEAWHGFSQTFLTPNQRRDLYKELREKKKGSFKDYNGTNVTFASASDLQLEEYLAESFREYVLSKGTKKDAATPKKNNIFEKIWNFLKELFGFTTYEDGVSSPLSVPKVAELYEKLRVGNLSEFTFNADNRSYGVLFSTIKAIDPQLETRTQLNYQDTKEIVDSVDSVFSEVMLSINQSTNSKKGTANILKTDFNKLVAYKGVKLKFEDNLDRLKAEMETLKNTPDTTLEMINNQQRLIDLQQWAITNFGITTDESVKEGEEVDASVILKRNVALGKGVIFSHLQKSKILTNEDKEQLFADSKDSDDANNTERTPFKKGDEYSLKDLASKEILYIIKGLYKTKVDKDNNAVTDKDGNPVRETNRLGFAKLNEFDESWNYLVRELAGNVTELSMQKKLDDLMNPETNDDGNLRNLVIQLNSRIGNIVNVRGASLPKDSYAWYLATNFWQTFNKTHIPLVQTTLDATYKKDADGKPLFNEINYKLLIGEASISSDKILKKWESGFISGLTSPYIKEQKIDITDKEFETIKYLDVPAILEKYKRKDIVDATKIGQSDEKIIKKAHSFLKDIGISLSWNSKVKNAFKNDAELKQAVIYIYDALLKSVEISKPINSINDIFTDVGDTIGMNNRLKYLMKLEAKSSNDVNSYMVFNASGEAQYEHSLNNTMTTIIEAINNAKSFDDLLQLPYMQMFNPKNNPFITSSLLMRSLFVQDKESANGFFGNKRQKPGTSKYVTLNLKNVAGTKVFEEKGNNEFGTSVAKTDPITKFITDYHNVMIYGVTEGPRHADKSSAYIIYSDYVIDDYYDDGNKAPENLLGSAKKETNRYIDTIDFMADDKKVITKDIDIQNTYAFKQITHKLKSYLKSELTRIKTMQELSEIKDLAYDWDYIKNGQRFHIFDGIFPKSLKDKLIKDGVAGITIYEKDINNAIANYFTNLTADGLKDQQQANYIDPSIKTKLRSLIKNNNITGGNNLSDKDFNRRLMMAYQVNRWLHNLESVTILYGDLALYNHEKQEFSKRIAGIASTGEIYRTSFQAINYVNSLGRKYGEKQFGISKNISSDATFDTAIMEDVIGKTQYLQEYEKAIKSYYNNIYKDNPAKAEKIIQKELKPYTEGEIKEGDAQGWITFDAYRALLNLQGKWNDEHEKMYMEIVNGTYKDSKDVFQFFPVLKVQYWGPLQTKEGLPPINAMHKFSLLPLVPNVIKGTNLEKLHHRMIKDNIDYSLFKSGSKVGTIGTRDVDKEGKIKNKSDDFYSDNEVRKIDEDAKFIKNTIFLNYLKDQLPAGDKYKKTITFPSQMRKLIPDGFFEKGLPKDFETNLPDDQREQLWNSLNDKERKQESPYYAKYRRYEELIDKFTKDKYEKLVKKIGWELVDGKPKGDLTKLVKYLQVQFETQDLSEQEKQFVREYEGKLANDLSLSLSAEKLEKILISVITREVFRQKIKGEGLIQVSVAGWETPADTRVQFDPTLQTYHIGEDGKTVEMEIMISLQGDFRKLLRLPKVLEISEQRKISKLDALNEVINDQEWLSDPNNRKMIMMTGTRIPTQGHNSMEFMRVKKFLPPNGANIVIAPTEIVAKAGSDFDIDKMFTIMPTIKVNEDGSVVFDADSIENQILDSQIDLLSDPNTFLNLIRPNSISIYEDIVEKISGDVTEYDPFTSYVEDPDRVSSKGKPIMDSTKNLEAGYNLYKHNRNFTAKSVLGIGATDNTMNIILNRIGMYMNRNVGMTLEEYYVNKRLIAKKYARKKEVFLNGKVAYLTHEQLKELVKNFAIQRLALPYNKKIVNGEEVISLSNAMDSNLEVRIADAISQMINGWVDVAKDDWIFTIQGNKELSPSLLFLTQAGVPVEQAIYFLSQPLIREYVYKQRANKGAFAGPTGNKPTSENLVNYKAQRDILVPIIGINQTETKKGPSPIYYDKIDLWEKTTARLQKYYKKPFDVNDLRNRIKSYNDAKKKGDVIEYTDFDKDVFLHFLEVEKMAKSMSLLKRTVNADTEKQSTLFEAQRKRVAIAELKTDGRIPEEMIDRIEKETVLGSFFKILDYQQEMWTDYFKIRNNKALTDFLLRSLSEQDTKNYIDRNFNNDLEKYANSFRNNFVPYLFQKQLYSFNIDKLTSYKGYDTQSSLKVENVDFLTFGAFVDNNTIYIDKKQLREDWANLNKPKEKPYMVAEVTQKDFASGPEEYYKFVIEREYLRSVWPFKRLSETMFFKINLEKNKNKFKKKSGDIIDRVYEENRLTYEETLRDMALNNIYNINHMFKSKEGMAFQLHHIKENYPDLTEGFDVLKNLGYQFKQKVGNIKLEDRKLDSDMFNLYTENIRDLSDTDKLAEVIPTASYDNKILIADFFKRLTFFSVLQSGYNTNTMFSIQRITDFDKFLRYIKPVTEMYTREENPVSISEDVLNDYKEAFERNNHYKNKTRNKINDYMSTSDTSYEDLYEEPQEDFDETIVPENVTYSYDKSRDYYSYNIKDLTLSDENIDKMADFIRNNPKTIFLYNDAVTELKGKILPVDTRYGYLLKQISKKYPELVNVIGIPTRNRYTSTRSTAVIKDTIIDNKKYPNQDFIKDFDAVIENIKKMVVEDEYRIAFDENGYGQILVKDRDIDPTEKTFKDSIETFKHISEKLYELGYRNPNFENLAPDSATKLAEKQPITDQMVYEKLKFCFGL